MALPRPVLLALLGTLLALAALMATRSISQVEPEPPLAPAPAKPAAKQAAAPAKAKAGAQRSAAGRRTQRAARPPARAGRAPLGVVRALAAGKPVVILFHQHKGGSSDDAAVHAAVETLRGTGAKVFAESLGALPRYRSLVGNLEISQTPATVVVGRKLDATLVEGYVDAGSLRQLVVDSRR